MRLAVLAFACGLVASCSGAVAAPATLPPQYRLTRIDSPPEPGAIPLYARVAPGSEHAGRVERWDQMSGQRSVRNVTRPTLTPFLPAPGNATGAAVIVAPGGGFLSLSMDNEGWPVARWLAQHGIAAFVLKYRTNPTPDDEAGTMAEIAAMFASAAKPGTSAAPPVRDPFATMDAQQALRMVRAHAGAWHIDAHRVGLLGFSAGAMAALEVVKAHDATALPDFTALLYGPMTPQTLPASTSPLFAALAADDPLMARAGYGLIDSWRAAGGNAELHLFGAGDHGFGMGRAATTSTHWPEEFLWWMESRGLLHAPPG